VLSTPRDTPILGAGGWWTNLLGLIALSGEDGVCEPCRRGDMVNCQNPVYPGITADGGYAEVMIAEARGIASIPDELTSVEAAPLLCAGITTYNALRNAGLRGGDLVTYLKTKNFHWHMSGPHFRDYHLLLDEQGDQLFAMTDAIAERVRKLGGTTLRSIGHVARLQRVLDNDAPYVEPEDMLAELRDDSKTLAARLREAHGVCEEYEDIATASLIEVWIDETERRTWFLFEAGRRRDSTGH
jgi:starvation-inducible DNA-binding protein